MFCRRTIYTWIAVSAALISLSACNNQNHKVFQGYIEGIYVYVSSPQSGRLLNIPVTRGTAVKVGDLLFKLDPQPERDQLREAQAKLKQAKETLNDISKGARQENLDAIKAQIDQAKAQLDFDQKTLQRYQKLLATNAIDKASVDQISSACDAGEQKIQELKSRFAEAKLGARTNQIKAQEAVVAAAKSQVEKLKWALQQKTKHAEVTGQVFDTYYSVGEFVNAGQPVLSILPPEQVKLIFFVPETILGHIKIGQAIQFNCDGCNESFAANISYISKAAEYTPPVIYSRSSRAKLVYRIEAKVSESIADKLHVGQPIDVYLNG
ncbi:MAG: HlyD family secretion protein [Gammaproteobacteria bacterium]|nr:HlyD family secretion protein [Gammaproteobacteria bacterium]